MHRFFRILLRISLQPVDEGGYPAYFQDSNIRIPVSDGGNQFIAHLRFSHARPTDDERNSNAAFVTGAFATQHVRTVVAKVNDDGVVRLAGVSQGLE